MTVQELKSTLQADTTNYIFLEVIDVFAHSEPRQRVNNSIKITPPIPENTKHRQPRSDVKNEDSISDSATQHRDEGEDDKCDKLKNWPESFAHPRNLHKVAAFLTFGHIAAPTSRLRNALVFSSVCGSGARHLPVSTGFGPATAAAAIDAAITNAISGVYIQHLSAFKLFRVYLGFESSINANSTSSVTSSVTSSNSTNHYIHLIARRTPDFLHLQDTSNTDYRLLVSPEVMPDTDLVKLQQIRVAQIYTHQISTRPFIRTEQIKWEYLPARPPSNHPALSTTDTSTSL